MSVSEWQVVWQFRSHKLGLLHSSYAFYAWV